MEKILLALALVSSVAMPIVIYRLLLARARAEIARVTGLLDQNLGMGARLLEVRDYYQQTQAALRKLLDEAYKEGNRHRQDELRRMLDRLETMKVRALDKTVNILSGESPQNTFKRRRRRPRHKGRSGPPPAQGNPPAGPAKT